MGMTLHFALQEARDEVARLTTELAGSRKRAEELETLVRLLEAAARGQVGPPAHDFDEAERCLRDEAGSTDALNPSYVRRRVVVLAELDRRASIVQYLRGLCGRIVSSRGKIDDEFALEITSAARGRDLHLDDPAGEEYASFRSPDGTETSLALRHYSRSHPPRSTSGEPMELRCVFRAPSWEAAKRLHELVCGWGPEGSPAKSGGSR